MDYKSKPLYTFDVHTSTEKELCCDAAHQTGLWVARYGCPAPKQLMLWADGSYAVVHVAEQIHPGYLVRPAMGKSLGLLQKHLQKPTKGPEAVRPTATEPADQKENVGKSERSGCNSQAPKGFGPSAYHAMSEVQLTPPKHAINGHSTLPSKVSLEEVGAKDDSLMAALKAAAQTCAAKAVSEVGKMKYVDGVEDDWEVVDGAAIAVIDEDEYDLVVGDF
ncbi:hypothetical protein LTR08_001912 [Meristemomyces frigidus]|nr:hypothetical protein LTR08_001912 [Meristemomyces frigidus]